MLWAHESKPLEFVFIRLFLHLYNKILANQFQSTGNDQEKALVQRIFFELILTIYLFYLWDYIWRVKSATWN